MGRIIRMAIFIFLVLFLASCNNKEKYTPPYYGVSEPTGGDNGESSGEIIAVPFIESGGVKYIEVELNRSFSVKMILDSGCSTSLISVAEAQLLYSKGGLTDDDFVGKSRSIIADGSVVENMVVNLREIVIGGKIICPNVQATVSSNTQAPLLLGNEVLNRTASYTVDNQNKTINFKLN